MSLATGFDLASREQWMSLVDQVLKGAPFDKKLTHTTYDGIQIQPLYTGADHTGTNSLPGLNPFIRGGDCVGGSWQVRQAHSLATGNRAILDDLAGGADAVELHVEGDISLAELEALLDGVPTTVPLMLAPGAGDAIWHLISLWEKRGVSKQDSSGGFGMNPTAPDVADVVAKTSDLGCDNLQVAVVDGAGLANQGATEAQELAGSLADGVRYLRACEKAGIDLAVAVQKLEFRYSAGVDQFLTIAKLRAARGLWARVTQACHIEPVAQRQHAVTANTMMTRHDSWVNMIRTTVATFAAAAGGANAITVNPFDAVIGVPDPLGLRIARNTQLLLREESHIGQVIDPAGGSHYVEWLTDALANAAWGLFQELEAGASLTERISASRDARHKDLATRKLPLTGVSEFPNLSEELLQRQPWPQNPQHTKHSSDSQDEGEQANGHDGYRLAEAFEALRDAASAHAKTGFESVSSEPISSDSTGSGAANTASPTVFLASLGPMAVHTARSSFAANLLAAGGIGVVSSEGFVSAQEAAQSWADSGCLVAVVCSSDAMYQDHGAATVSALKEAGCGFVLLAGRPDNRWGADGYIYMGCNVLAVLHEVHERLGI